MIDINGVTVSTDMLIGFAGGLGVGFARGLVWKALVAGGAALMMFGGLDLGSLLQRAAQLIPM